MDSKTIIQKVIDFVIERGKDPKDFLIVEEMLYHFGYSQHLWDTIKVHGTRIPSSPEQEGAVGKMYRVNLYQIKQLL